ncbi:ABC transporter ATP-binding protein [Clostridiaceae bacterium HSG29]|nr:ABC transporter ATP-binding protein [Clostridiaceae bacterium HSG29]
MIKVINVSKYYKANFPIKDFSYTFEDNKKYVISGASGSGKTTFLRLIAGLESLDNGEIYRDEVLIGNTDFQFHPLKREIGMVFQNPTLWPHMTVRENINYGVKNRNNDEIISIMKIDSILDKFPDEISGGEAKRVALSRMMVLKWKYLLLDEPLTNIDKELKSDILSFINDYAEKNNTTLIYVTHNDEEAKAIEGISISF